jgi:branched-chain amino acid transport system ATP-binding protein
VSATLTLEHIVAGYDQADVLTDVSLTATAGKITCLLGANGSGKTTLIRAILGLTPPRAGRVLLNDIELTGMQTHRVIAHGIACIPEGRRVFPRLTVAENLKLGAYLETAAEKIAARSETVMKIFPRLKERYQQFAGTLSGGEQAMLSIGRGLMAEPKVLLIDEPSLGLSPLFVQENFRVIQDVNAQGITIFLVEQNVHQTLAIAHAGYVLAQGRVAAAGSADELRENAEVHAAYFG